MIPVRVPADMKPGTAVPVLANERRFVIQPGHPLATTPCPVCDRALEGTEPDPAAPLTRVTGPAVVLVFVGIAPEDRKPSGWTTGAAVAVHAACAGVAEAEPEVDPDGPDNH